jgi:nitronate monooxygenase
VPLPKQLAGLRLPVIGSPLFIISNPKLVIAQCKAGIVGSMPALNARPAAQLDEWLAEITETLAAHDRDHPESPAAPFAINQIVHKSNDRLEHDMEVCARYKVPDRHHLARARAPMSTRPSTAGAASCCTTSSTTRSRTRRSRRAPTA